MSGLAALTPREMRKWWRSSRQYLRETVSELPPLSQLHCTRCGFPAWELRDGQRGVKIGQCTEDTCGYQWEW